QTITDNGHVTTIDRYDQLIQAAKITHQKLGLEDKITLLEGQAADILPTLTDPYDFIFMDSAKSKYLEFLPDCMRLLKQDGILMVDDIFQGGTILDPVEEIPRKKRGIHRKLNQFLEVINDHHDLTTTLIRLGHGITLISTNEETIAI